MGHTRGRRSDFSGKMARVLAGFFQHERAPVLISAWDGPLGSATLDFLKHAFELKQSPGVGRTLRVEQRIKIPDRHSLFRAFAEEVHLLFPVVIDGADLRGFQQEANESPCSE